jgi:iron complex outermembrane recepter protein
MKYNVSRTVSVFANAGNSFLPPGLRSMGGTIKLVDRGVPGRHGQLPNPGLKPESGMGADAGAGIRLNANLDFALRGFYMNVTDAIVENIVSADPSQTQSVNAGNTTSRGFEIEVGQALNPSFSWFANYTYMKTAVKNEMDADQDGATVPFAPSNILNAGISISTAFGLKVNPVLNYNGGYYDSSSLSGRNVFTPGALINLLVSQLVAVKEDYNLDIFISAYNLTNNKFEMPWQFQNTGLAITGGFKMSFR